MIDIENAKERDLKNIRQIGNPTEDDKIYIEKSVHIYGTHRMQSGKICNICGGGDSCTGFGVCAKYSQMGQSCVERHLPGNKTFI